MNKEKIFCRMIEMEKASNRNPNLLQTYEVIWNKLKEELQFTLREDQVLKPTNESQISNQKDSEVKE